MNVPFGKVSDIFDQNHQKCPGRESHIEEKSMPFDDIDYPARRGPVAEAAEKRYDAATCRAERQEPAKPVEIDGDRPDVGEGWREIGPGEILQAGDEVDVGVNCRQWVPTQRGGVRIGDEEDNYRRRVTTKAQPIKITPAAISAMCERNAREALLKSIENLKAENHEQQDRLLQTSLENERLRSEVEIDAKQIATREAIIERLRSEVERLREDLFRSQLSLKERKAVAFAEQHFVYFKNQARTLRGLLKRLGGGK